MILKYGCTREQMEEVLQNTLTIVFLPDAKYLNQSAATSTHPNLV